MSILLNVGASLVGSATKKRREPYGEGEDGGWGDPQIIAAVVWFSLWLVLVAIGVAVAMSCGAGFREYAVVVLDPWTYILIRLAVPCMTGGDRGARSER